MPDSLKRPFRTIRGAATNYRTQYYETKEERDKDAATFAEQDGQSVICELWRDGAWWMDADAKPHAETLDALDFDPDPGEGITTDAIVAGDRITIWAFPQPFGVVGGYTGLANASEYMGIVADVERGTYEGMTEPVVRVTFDDGREVEAVKIAKTKRHFDSTMPS